MIGNRLICRMVKYHSAFWPPHPLPMDWYLDILKNHYVDFEGRVGRRLFWMFVLVNIGISIAISIVIGIVSDGLASALSGLFSLAILLPSIGMGIRRLHDTGKTGWLMLLAFIPLLGAIALIVLYALPGDPGPNEYGPEPHDMDASFA